MRYLVTGGAGFIGSSFVRALLAAHPDARVVNLDALTYAGHTENLDGIADDPRYTFVHGDIRDAGLVRDLMRETDIVFNLAAESHVDRSIASAQPFIETNIVGTATLLATALDAGVERFVQVSTDEVYGELEWADPDAEASVGATRFTEETPVAPRSPYSASKAAADHLAHAYHATHGLDVVITRCSNNYGPRQFPEKLIPVVIHCALSDEPVPVYGDGLNVRDWIHVDDHCRGLLAAAERGRAGRVYNFGGDAERTNLSLVRAILSVLGKPESLITFVPDRAGHDRRYAIDFRRATSELGWAPRIRLDEGLADTVAWYRDHAAWVEAVTAFD